MQARLVMKTELLDLFCIELCAVSHWSLFHIGLKEWTELNVEKKEGYYEIILILFRISSQTEY